MPAYARAVLAQLLVTGALTSCTQPAPESRPSTPEAPLDRAAYRALLERQVGGPVSVGLLAARAEQARREIGARMGLLAETHRPGVSWRELFAELRRDRPADAEGVLAAYREELVRAEEFVRTQNLVTLPPARPEVVRLENAALRAHFPLALYHGGHFAVTTAPGEDEDPGYLMNHCRVCVPPLVVHEGYPGHHVALSGLEETVAASELARHKAFVEGWGLYAETLMLERGYYAGAEWELGAWRMLLLRILRAEIDARLNGGGLSGAAAAALYRDELLLSPEAAAAEVRVHLAKPGVKASYLVGLLQILELRAQLQARASGLSDRAFHDRLLGPPAPLPRIARERFGVELGPPGEAEIPLPWR